MGGGKEGEGGGCTRDGVKVVWILCCQCSCGLCIERIFCQKESVGGGKEGEGGDCSTRNGVSVVWVLCSCGLECPRTFCQKGSVGGKEGKRGVGVGEVGGVRKVGREGVGRKQGYICALSLDLLCEKYESAHRSKDPSAIKSLDYFMKKKTDQFNNSINS